MIRRIILICIAAYIIYRFFKLCLVLWANHLKKKYGNFENSKITIGGKTIKCDNCGSYAAEELSANIKHKGEDLHFCSDECKDAYLKKQ